jgi:hypothetical protein
MRQWKSGECVGGDDDVDERVDGRVKGILGGSRLKRQYFWDTIRMLGRHTFWDGGSTYI